mgnify:CR=1 FL=1
MPIYTKKGDKGETGIFNGKRVSKSDALIEAIGAVDELNATLGVAVGEIKNQKSKIKIAIQKIQSDLFAIGARLAGAEIKIDLGKIVLEMETEIDQMWGEMPPLKNFILPSGQIHLARTVCRRAERRVVSLVTRTYNLEPVVRYLNRLSDYLFCLARFVNFKTGVKEKVWMS